MKLTTALIAAALALYAFGARNGRTSSSTGGAGKSAKADARPEPSKSANIDPGMVILRNDHIDDGIAIRSPFGGDPGIARLPRPESGSKEVSS